MKSMATLSNGVYMEPTDKAIKTLCNYFTAQVQLVFKSACTYFHAFILRISKVKNIFLLSIPISSMYIYISDWFEK